MLRVAEILEPALVLFRGSRGQGNRFRGSQYDLAFRLVFLNQHLHLVRAAVLSVAIVESRSCAFQRLESTVAFTIFQTGIDRRRGAGRILIKQVAFRVRNLADKVCPHDPVSRAGCTVEETDPVVVEAVQIAAGAVGAEGISGFSMVIHQRILDVNTDVRTGAKGRRRIGRNDRVGIPIQIDVAVRHRIFGSHRIILYGHQPLENKLRCRAANGNTAAGFCVIIHDAAAGHGHGLSAGNEHAAALHRGIPKIYHADTAAGHGKAAVGHINTAAVVFRGIAANGASGHGKAGAGLVDAAAVVRLAYGDAGVGQREVPGAVVDTAAEIIRREALRDDGLAGIRVDGNVSGLAGIQGKDIRRIAKGQRSGRIHTAALFCRAARDGTVGRDGSLVIESASGDGSTAAADRRAVQIERALLVNSSSVGRLGAAEGTAGNRHVVLIDIQRAAHAARCGHPVVGEGGVGNRIPGAGRNVQTAAVAPRLAVPEGRSGHNKLSAGQIRAAAVDLRFTAVKCTSGQFIFSGTVMIHRAAVFGGSAVRKGCVCQRQSPGFDIKGAAFRSGRRAVFKAGFAHACRRVISISLLIDAPIARSRTVREFRMAGDRFSLVIFVGIITDDKSIYICLYRPAVVFGAAVFKGAAINLQLCSGFRDGNGAAGIIGGHIGKGGVLHIQIRREGSDRSAICAAVRRGAIRERAMSDFYKTTFRNIVIVIGVDIDCAAVAPGLECLAPVEGTVCKIHFPGIRLNRTAGTNRCAVLKITVLYIRL